MSLRLTRFEFERLQARRKNAVCKTAAQANAKKKTPFVKPGGRWEADFAAQLDEAGLVGYTREYRFHPTRRFRFDFAFVPQLVAVEIDGAVHRIDNRFRSDRQKFQLALTRGWRVLRVGADQVRDGEALSLLKLLIS